MDVYDIFLRTLRRIGPPGAGQRVLTAVSGGADSVALLHLLLRLREGGTSFDLAVAHLDHGVRGEAGRSDAAYVADLAARHDLPLIAGRLAEASSPSEEHLRRARQSFLAEKAAAWRADQIALGHTRDDQAETAILNLLRGSGSRGLGGMRLTRRLAGPGLPPLIIRPLLEISRAALRDWLRELEIAWREDGTNTSPRYLRNRVRAELMPLLEDLRPGARDTLARAAGLLQDDNDLLESLARRELARLDSVNLDAHSLASLPRAIARRVVRIAAAEGTIPRAQALLDSGPAAVTSRPHRVTSPSLAGSAGADRTNKARSASEVPWAPGARQVEAVLDMAAAGGGGQVDLGRGRVARLSKGVLTFHRPRDTP